MSDVFELGCNPIARCGSLRGTSQVVPFAGRLVYSARTPAVPEIAMTVIHHDDTTPTIEDLRVAVASFWLALALAIPTLMTFLLFVGAVIAFGFP